MEITAFLCWHSPYKKLNQDVQSGLIISIYAMTSYVAIAIVRRSERRQKSLHK
ncbi:hypothetical protein [Sphingobacterium spiritivorum]|uniref:hypothetical protein n=1 Tax=Sphingobacterium spiritivorum TaxID=258 RepID=UPI0015F16EC3|nr:hypothetical protein [Sphingobacterium spiritivorum]